MSDELFRGLLLVAVVWSAVASTATLILTLRRERRERRRPFVFVRPDDPGARAYVSDR